MNSPARNGRCKTFACLACNGAKKDFLFSQAITSKEKEILKGTVVFTTSNTSLE
jgi:hypothetical protein